MDIHARQVQLGSGPIHYRKLLVWRVQHVLLNLISWSKLCQTISDVVITSISQKKKKYEVKSSDYSEKRVFNLVQQEFLLLVRCYIVWREHNINESKAFNYAVYYLFFWNNCWHYQRKKHHPVLKTKNRVMKFKLNK